MIWLLMILCAFATGAAAPSRWTIALWPVVSGGVGIYAVASEPTNYDMHGFGYALGGLAAIMSAVAWLVGRLLRRLATRRQ